MRSHAQPESRLCREIPSLDVERGLPRARGAGRSLIAVLLLKGFSGLARICDRIGLWSLYAGLVLVTFHAVRLPRDVGTVAASGSPEFSGEAHEATFSRPYQMHASMGPSCAVAVANDDGLTVWTHT